MGYGPKNRCVRSVIIWTIAIIIIVAACAGILYFQGLQSQLGSDFVIVDDCPAGVSKVDAVQDIHNVPKL